MAEEVLRLERRERVAILTLNRPDRLNALSIELREALVHACQELRDDDNIWAVVLTGAGRGFCSGVDLRASRPDSEQAASRQERLDTYGWVGRQAMAVYRTLDKPIIAAVNGVAAGAGMSLALSCDLRVGSELTRFKTVFIERSLSPDSGLSFFLPRIVGYSRACTHRNLLHTHAGYVCAKENRIVDGLFTDAITELLHILLHAGCGLITPGKSQGSPLGSPAALFPRPGERAHE